MENKSTTNDSVIKQILKDGGFYGNDHIWNSIIMFPNDKHIYRHRVETIVIRNQKEIYLKKKPDGHYFLPGGSIEKNVSNKQQAINECNEEAMIDVKNIKFSGYTYKEITGCPKWAKELKINKITWDAKYTDVFVAEYDSKFSGKVNDYDKDSFMMSGKWYPIEECMRFFREEHKNAIKEYMKTSYNQQYLESTTNAFFCDDFKFEDTDEIMFLSNPVINYKMINPYKMFIFKNNADYNFNYAVINKYDESRKEPYSVIVIECNKICAIIDNNFKTNQYPRVLSIQSFESERIAYIKWKTCIESLNKKSVNSMYFKDRDKLKSKQIRTSDYNLFLEFVCTLKTKYLKDNVSYYVESDNLSGITFTNCIEYGLPKRKKYPLKGKNFKETKELIKSNIKYFNINHETPEDEAILAKNIIKAMDSLKMSKNLIGERNRLRLYL